MFKSGDRLDIQNYRPVSLISNLAKIFEKIIKNRLYSYLKKYNIISNCQYGFQEGLSTEDAISNLTKRIYSSLDSKQPSIAVFLDLAKAFDTVDFNILHSCLQNIGIRGNSLKLFKNYLNERKQFVQIKDVKSSPRKVICGVPQGTVLGPILFLIYINDLFSLDSCAEIISFADDTVLFYNDNDWINLKNKIEKDLAKCFLFFNSRLLTVNFNKTFFIPFSSYKNKQPDYSTIETQIESNTIKIKSCETIKYLGIYVDKHLKWNEHIHFVTKKIRSITYIFHELQNVLELKDFKTLYHSLVEPHFRYGILAWGATYNVYMEQLTKIQKRIFKIMMGKRMRYPTQKLYDEIGLYDLKQLYFISNAIYYYKNKQYLEVKQHKHSTRSMKEEKYLIEFRNKVIGQKNFTYLGKKLFNYIPKDIRHLNPLQKFKVRLKSFVFEHRDDILSLFL